MVNINSFENGQVVQEKKKGLQIWTHHCMKWQWKSYPHTTRNIKRQCGYDVPHKY